MFTVPITVPHPFTEQTDRTFTITSPVDGSVIGRVADCRPEDVDLAVAAARRGSEALAAISPFERAELCRRVADELLDHEHQLGEVIAWETGRTLAGAHDEVAKAASGLRLAAEEIVRLRGEVVPVRDASKLTFTTRHPTGIWAVLSPWNFPVNIPLEYIGPAIASANPVIWKPAPSTTLSAHIVQALMSRAGVPAGAVVLLPTDTLATAEALTRHPEIVGIGLTGSTRTGQAVSAAAAGKELILELGGNGPIIVFDDADLDLAADAIATSSFAASGQVCSAGGRILADAGIADDLAQRVADRADRYRLGNPFAPETVIGPLHDVAVAERVRGMISDAVGRGAVTLTGTSRDTWPTPNYVPATVVARVPLGAPLEAEETFGPVAPIVPVRAQDMVEIANAGAHALSTAVFTRDIDRALDAAARLKFGTVNVNDRSSFWELHLPFGGWTGRASGTGRVGVRAVLERMTQIKTTSFTHHPRRTGAGEPPSSTPTENRRSA